MDSLRFLEGILPADYTKKYSESLFNSVVHRHTQSARQWLSFYVVNEITKSAEAGFHLCIQERNAYSPYKAPFGGVDFSLNLPTSVLEDFLHFIENNLIAKEIHRIQIKLPPAAYSTIHTALASALGKRMYSAQVAEIGSVIQITHKPFTECIHSKELHILQRSKNKNYFSKQLPLERLASVYSFIKHHQQLKGYTVSMTLEDLEKTVNACPQYFNLFVAEKEEQIVAASISIQVREKILYNFYLAHDDQYKKDSPVLIIMEALYIFCQEHAYALLDLGTSMLGEKINQPLLQFKSRLGAQESAKLTFMKQLQGA